MNANEKAPGRCCNSAEGGDRTNYEEETIAMNTTVIHPDVQQIFDQLADLPSDSMLVLRPEDVFHQTILGVYRVGSWAFPTIVQQLRPLVVGTTHPFWTIVGPDGRVTRDVPGGFDAWLVTVHGGIAVTPNAVVRHGDYLVISHGVYQIKSVDYSGVEPIYELINFTEEELREQAESDAFLAAHPEIRAAQPKWAETAEVMGSGGGEVNVMFERDLGNVTISQWGTFENGAFAMSEDEPLPTITVERLEAVGEVEFIRSVAQQMLAAAQLVEEAAA